MHSENKHFLKKGMKKVINKEKMGDEAILSF